MAGKEHTVYRDDIVSTIHNAKIIRKKPLLKKLYADNYSQFKKFIAGTRRKSVIEFGSGGGFIKEIIPEAITSDILQLPDVMVSLSLTCMPLKSAAVDAVFLFDVMHHVRDVRAFFRELTRTLKPGGRIMMIEPANTCWSRFVYKRFHSEPFDVNGGWGIAGDSPLRAANGALPWIVFCRDRERFMAEFPSLKIIRVEPHTPLRYLVSGGLSGPQLLPGCMYAFCRAVERIIAPLNRYLGMFMTIQLVKQENNA